MIGRRVFDKSKTVLPTPFRDQWLTELGSRQFSQNTTEVFESRDQRFK